MLDNKGSSAILKAEEYKEISEGKALIMSDNNPKRDCVLCIRVHPEIKEAFEKLAEQYDESPSAIARKCLTCFTKANPSCDMRKRYSSPI